MRYGLLALGAAVGAGMAYAAMAQRSKARTAGPRETPEPRHGVQGDDEREAVAALIDEVVHEPGVPDTIVKQAFAHALEAR